MKYMAKFRTTPPPQPVLFSLYGEEPGGGRPASLAEPPGPQERVPQRNVEPMLETFVPVLSLDVPVLQMVDQSVDILQILDVPLPEMVIDVPKISLDSAPQRTLLPEPQLAEQLVEVPVRVPSFDEWVRWEETYRRTGHTWLGGFDRCLTASPGRYINTRPGYRAASVPAHRQSGGDPWLRLSRHLRTVQTAQFWGVRGELQRYGGL